MIRPLTSLAQQPDVAAAFGGLARDQPPQIVHGQMVRARTGDDHAPVLNQAQAQIVDATVGGQPLRGILAALDEGGRIEADEIKTAALVGQALQGFQRVAGHGFARAARSVALQIARGKRQSRRRSVQKRHRRRAGAGRGHAKAAGVAEGVQHPDIFSRRKTRRVPAVEALIVKPAGFLAFGQRNQITRAVFKDFDFVRNRPHGLDAKGNSTPAGRQSSRRTSSTSSRRASMPAAVS